MTNTIILTVHNKEKTILKILNNLCKNSSKNSIELIIILDGCTDKTSSKIKEFMKSFKVSLKIKVLVTNDVWETRANNIGLNQVKTDYATLVQDDMLIMQKNWDLTLLRNFQKFKLFAVSGRAGHEFCFENNQFKVLNLFGREYPLSNRHLIGKIIGKFIVKFKLYWIYNYYNFFSKRLVVNRGPLMLDMKKAKELNFFDEIFSPFELDDIDLCCRAYKKYGLLSGANPIFYYELNGSKKYNISSQKESIRSIKKNTKILIERHLDLAIK